MKAGVHFTMDYELKVWFSENYMGKQSRIVNIIVKKLKEAKESGKKEFTVKIN